MDCSAHGGWDNLVEMLIEEEALIEPIDRGGVCLLHDSIRVMTFCHYGVIYN